MFEIYFSYEMTLKYFQQRKILVRLDTDIKNFRGNAIKESIKRGYEEMAEHKLTQGDIQGALRFFSKSRDYCIQPQHVRNMCLNVIKASGIFY